MRWVLLALGLLLTPSAWAQPCSTSNYTKCPTPVYKTLDVDPTHPIHGDGSALINLPFAHLTVTAATSNGSGGLGSLPASSYIVSALCRETAGHAVNIAIGTTSGGSDVAAAFTVPASGTVTATTQAFSLVWFSASATQALFVSSASWGSASVNCYLNYQPGP